LINITLLHKIKEVIPKKKYLFEIKGIGVLFNIIPPQYVPFFLIIKSKKLK